MLTPTSIYCYTSFTQDQYGAATGPKTWAIIEQNYQDLVAEVIASLYPGVDATTVLDPELSGFWIDAEFLEEERDEDADFTDEHLEAENAIGEEIRRAVEEALSHGMEDLRDPDFDAAECVSRIFTVPTGERIPHMSQ